eukprot:12711339-Alexandrium_andersonii.AAC.1
MQARQAKFVQWPFERANEQHSFRFGSRPPTSSLGRYRIPIALAGHIGEIRILAVQEKVPAFLSRSAMTQLHMILDTHQAVMHVQALG